jgi:hypothetical protein
MMLGIYKYSDNKIGKNYQFYLLFMNHEGEKEITIVCKAP